MNEANHIVETIRRNIVDMLWRKQDMRGARFVENVDSADLLAPPVVDTRPRPQPPATFGDHLAVLNCPGFHSAEQHAESMAEVFGNGRHPPAGPTQT